MHYGLIRAVTDYCEEGESGGQVKFHGRADEAKSHDDVGFRRELATTMDTGRRAVTGVLWVCFAI